MLTGCQRIKALTEQVLYRSTVRLKNPEFIPDIPNATVVADAAASSAARKLEAQVQRCQSIH